MEIQSRAMDAQIVELKLDMVNYLKFIYILISYFQVCTVANPSVCTS